MKSATSKSTTRTKKATDEEKKPAGKTTTASKTSGTKPALGRSKTDVGTKKPRTSKVANISSTDYEKLPSYMRPTASSRRNATSVGSQGKPEEAGQKTPTKTSSKLTSTTASKSKKPKTKTGSTKKPKEPSKASGAEKSPVSNVDTPTPEQLSTEPVVDGAVAVGLRPTTPPTLQQDSVTHPSDNDSTGGLMETVDENPNDTCNVKQWTLFPEAMRESEDHRTTTAQMKSEEDETAEALRGRSEGLDAAGEDACAEETDESKKPVDAPVAEKLVTTETAVVVDSSDEEEDRQGSVDPAADDGVAAVASSSDPPSAEAAESRTEDAVEETVAHAAAVVPSDDQTDPAAAEPAADAVANNEDETALVEETVQQPAVEQKESSEDPQEPSVVQQAAGESSGEGQQIDPKEPEMEAENGEAGVKVEQEVEAGADPKDETAEQPVQPTLVNKEQETAQPEETAAAAETTPEPQVEKEVDNTPVEEQQSRDPAPTPADDSPASPEESSASIPASAE